MNISLLLQMAVSDRPERPAIADGDLRLSVQEVSDLVDKGAAMLAGFDSDRVVYTGTGGAILPILIFACARAGKTFTPLNYRLSGQRIEALLDRLPGSVVVVDHRYRDVLDGQNRVVVESGEFLRADAGSTCPAEADYEGVAVVLFTSGTTSAPKAVELTHANLTSYITETVEFGSAGASDAALICVPPYHIAGINAAISNIYAGRKMVFLTEFDAEDWIRLVNAERISTATVVPTMLDRIVATLERRHTELPSLRTLAYGGAKVSQPLLRRALALMPHVGFVNAYGLTETSSTIAVLTPEDHRRAYQSRDPQEARRLRSVGRAVPGIEIQIRDPAGATVKPGDTGELYVRGAQVSGRYTEIGSVLDEEGWFATKDIASIDEDGYLFIGGRSDDTIIRGAENIAPAEIEDVLIEHPDVNQAAVVGVEDQQWGQIIVAVVVLHANRVADPEALREYVRGVLRGSRTPDRIVYRDELPTNSTGKVLRRELAAELSRHNVDA